MYNERLYENYSFIEKHCSDSLLARLRSEYEYDGDGYAVWLFRSGAQDGPSDENHIVEVRKESDGWYSYRALDMGIEFTRFIRLGEKDGGFIIEDVRDTDSFFSCIAIPDDTFEFMQGRSYKAECIIPRDSLRYITCLHRDADGVVHMGEMVLSASVAEDVLDILRQLYEAGYPIERMRLVDYYDADDETSMRANNSSGFNFRFISHTSKVSTHGRGVAVDINPLYNPYHKTLKNGREVVEPSGSEPYLDRNADFPYKIVKGDLCYRLFIRKGFTWGGDWKCIKDYQHFEK